MNSTFQFLDVPCCAALAGFRGRSVSQCKPRDLGKPGMRALAAKLAADCHAAGTLLREQNGGGSQLPEPGILRLASPAAAAQMSRLPGEAWLQWARQALAADAALLQSLPEGIIEKPLLLPALEDNPRGEGTSLIARLFGGAKKSGELPADFSPQEETRWESGSGFFEAIDFHMRARMSPSAKDLDAAARSLEELAAALEAVPARTAAPPFELLCLLGEPALRAVAKTGDASWSSVLRACLQRDRDALEELREIGDASLEETAESFQGSPWKCDERELEKSPSRGISRRDAERLAERTCGKMEKGASNHQWRAALEDHLVAHLRKLPDARLLRCGVLAAAAGKGETVELGVASSSTLRVRMVLSGKTNLCIQADWQVQKGGKDRAKKMLAQMRRREIPDWLVSVRTLGRAWAERSPLASWAEVLASLESPTPATWRHLAQYQEELAEFATHPGRLAGLLHRLPGIVALSPWPTRFSAARVVFHALRSQPRELAEMLRHLAEGWSTEYASAQNLRDYLIISRIAGVFGDRERAAAAILELVHRFGGPEKVYEVLMAWLICPLFPSGRTLEEWETQVADCLREIGGRVVSRSLDQWRRHAENSLPPLMEALHFSSVLIRAVVEGIAEKLQKMKPAAPSAGWQKPSDLHAEKWIEALLPFARLAQTYAPGAGWTEEKLVDLWPWLLDGTATGGSPALAPGCFYGALAAWLAGRPLDDDCEEMREWVSQALRYRVQDWIDREDGPALAARFAQWVDAHASVVPWKGIAQEWIYLCCASGNQETAIRRWHCGLGIFAAWGRASGTSRWLSDLAHGASAEDAQAAGLHAPWESPRWRELVPLFMENDGGFPPGVAVAVVEEVFLFDAPEQRFRCLSLFRSIPRHAGENTAVACEIEAGVARAMSRREESGLFSAEQAIFSLGGLLLSAEHNAALRRWSELLPEEGLGRIWRLRLLSTFVTRVLQPGRAAEEGFSGNLKQAWPCLVQSLFPAGRLPLLLECARRELSSGAVTGLRLQTASLLAEFIEQIDDSLALLKAAAQLTLALPEEGRAMLARRFHLQNRLLRWAMDSDQPEERLRQISDVFGVLDERVIMDAAACERPSDGNAQAYIRCLAPLRPSLRGYLESAASLQALDPALREALLHVQKSLLATATPNLAEVWIRFLKHEIDKTFDSNPQLAASLAAAAQKARSTS